MTQQPVTQQLVTGAARSRQAAARIYVLPTRLGGAFVLLALLTLVGCINYLLSLGYALTFLLLSVWVVGAVHASRVLGGLEVALALPERSFAGGAAALVATVQLPPGPPRFPVGVRSGSELAWLPDDTQEVGTLTLLLPTPRRGPQPLPTLRLEGHDPLGLWHSTRYPEGPELPSSLLVYPAPEQSAPPPPLAAAQDGAQEGQRRSGDEELHGLREYRPGDALRRIAWKQTARLGDPLTRLYDAPAAAALNLDWERTRALGDSERRLSRLTAWVLEAERLGAPFVLRLPGSVLEVPAGSAGGSGGGRALELLARYELPDLPPTPRRSGPFRRPAPPA